MKYCASCGKELNIQAKFCTGCGQKCTEIQGKDVWHIPLPQTPPQHEGVQVGKNLNSEINTPTKEIIQSKDQDIHGFRMKPISETSTGHNLEMKKTISKGKIVLFTILAVVLIVAIAIAVLVFRWYTSTEQRILRALDVQDYDAVAEIMEEDEFTNESEEVVDHLRERIAKIKAGYENGTIDYATAKKELETIGKLNIDGISSELSGVRGYIDQLYKSRINFSNAESFYATGDYREAIAYYRLVIEDDENYMVATEKYLDSVNKYREEILTKAAKYADTELYSDAIALLTDALNTIPNDARITEQIRIYDKNNIEKLKEDALEIAANYAKNGDYLSAFKALTYIRESQAADAELVSAYNKYCEQYASQIISVVDEKVSQKDFDGAISALNVALKNLPGNEVLLSKQEEVKAMQPIPITTLLTVNASEWEEWNEGVPSDPFGNDYSVACNYVCIGKKNGERRNTYVEYRLYGKYETITGTIAPHNSCDNGPVAYLQIYADDELVYTSPDIDRKTDAIPFSVNISGADYIKIVVRTYYGAVVILSDIRLWP